MMNNKIDDKFMMLTIRKARQSISKGLAPFGACIIKDGKIICCALNIVMESMDLTAHAEINAIKVACKKLKTIDLSGCILYTTCEPCPMCFCVCHKANISKIIYGARISDLKKIDHKGLNIPINTMKQLCNSEIKIVGDFFREKNIKLFKLWLKEESKHNRKFKA